MLRGASVILVNGLFPALLLALAACAQTSAPAPAAAPASVLPTAGSTPAGSSGPITRERASTDCWMRYDKEGRALSLDQRLALVEKCIAEKMKAAGS